MISYLCGQYVHYQFNLSFFPRLRPEQILCYKSFNFMTQVNLKKKKSKSVMLFLEINLWFFSWLGLDLRDSWLGLGLDPHDSELGFGLDTGDSDLRFEDSNTSLTKSNYRMCDVCSFRNKWFVQVEMWSILFDVTICFAFAFTSSMNLAEDYWVLARPVTCLYPQE